MTTLHALRAADSKLGLADRVGAWLLTGPVGRAAAFGIELGVALARGARHVISGSRRS